MLWREVSQERNNDVVVYVLEDQADRLVGGSIDQSDCLVGGSIYLCIYVGS
jgi:hypothetical protein